MIYLALYFMWNFLPEAFNAMLSSLKPVGGGAYGHGHHGHHLSRNGNKYGSGGLEASYDDYDYNYSAAAEHYVSLMSRIFPFNILTSVFPCFLFVFCQKLVVSALAVH